MVSFASDFSDKNTYYKYKPIVDNWSINDRLKSIINKERKK